VTDLDPPPPHLAFSPSFVNLSHISPLRRTKCYKFLLFLFDTRLKTGIICHDFELFFLDFSFIRIFEKLLFGGGGGGSSSSISDSLKRDAAIVCNYRCRYAKACNCAASIRTDAAAAADDDDDGGAGGPHSSCAARREAGHAVPHVRGAACTPRQSASPLTSRSYLQPMATACPSCFPPVHPPTPYSPPQTPHPPPAAQQHRRPPPSSSWTARALRHATAAAGA
jgi:hypothetical protein